MRLLPCRSKKCAGEPVLLPSGEPYIAGRYVKKARCSRCKTVTEYRAADFASLPSLSAADFEKLAKEYHLPRLAELPTQDFEGAGFTKREAADLFDKGFRRNEDIDAWTREVQGL